VAWPGIYLLGSLMRPEEPKFEAELDRERKRVLLEWTAPLARKSGERCKLPMVFGATANSNTRVRYKRKAVLWNAATTERLP